MRISVYKPKHGGWDIVSEVQRQYPFTVQLVSDLPTTVEKDEVLIVYADRVSIDLAQELKYLDREYIMIIAESNNDGSVATLADYSLLMRRTGCVQTYGDTTDRGKFISELPRMMELIKINEIASDLARNEWNLLRNIYRAMNGKKAVLSYQLFGESGESTFDVNLSRLRKKLQDPKIGNDFIRIHSKNSRVYATTKLSEFAIDSSFFLEAMEADSHYLDSLKAASLPKLDSQLAS